MTGRPKRRQDDQGVALVELAALTPFILFFALLVWQVIMIGLTSMFASHASAEGARQAAVTPYDAEKIEEQAKKRISVPWNSDDAFSIDSDERNLNTYIQVEIKIPIVLPGFNSTWDIGAETKVVLEDTVERIP